MIELSFEQFYRQQYRDCGYQLYVMKNGLDEPLYVGITSRTVWERWFDFGGHVFYDGVRLWGHSLVGQKIEDHFPDSLKWKIQLWTLKDCLRFCKSILPTSLREPTVEFIEPFMIQKIRPTLNLAYNLNPGRDSMPNSQKELEREKKLDDIYREIFG